VVLGDTLWDIAYTAYGKGVNWIDIWHANEDIILNPRYIYPNQVFFIPIHGS
jgi:nucleoid-associated protein YgaU